MTADPSRDRFDVVVLGTGAAGLTAALAATEAGARVGLLERADMIGGSTAISGGACWVPNSSLMAAAGIDDSRDEALVYLRALAHGMVPDELLVTFVDESPRIIDWLHDVAGIRFRVMTGYPDYHTDYPGAKPGGGRSLDPGLFSYHLLGDWSDRILTPPRGLHFAITDTPLGGGDGVIPPEEMAEREAHDLRGCGHGLIGPMLHALIERGIEPQLSTRALELIVDSGRIVGVDADTGGQRRRIAASAGVILCTGGFEWDPSLAHEFLRGPMNAPASVPTSTGDGLLMAIRAGAALGNMYEAWWMPCVYLPGGEVLGEPAPYLINRERTLPRSIIVNSAGNRFVNEAANYNAFGSGFHQMNPNTLDYDNVPAYLVLDSTYLERYGFEKTRPGAPAPSYFTTAPTLTALADALGVDGEQLVKTVDRWNKDCANGRDTQFDRGSAVYDRWSGDTRFRGTKESTLGPIEDPPFYAIEVRSGTLGTKGGPKTTTHGQVIDTYGTPIPGLYAAGNTMASPFGRFYAGAGATLSLAVTFGYLAGNAAARERQP